MEPTDIEIDAGHIAPLEADKIPDVNQSHHCFSCEAPMSGVYCMECGQKNDNYRRSLFSLIKEYFGSVTGIESRIWRTWGALLFKPGKVAREYADGRRTHWSSPVRVYLAMSIILFGFLSFTEMQLISIDLDVNPIEGVDKPTEDLTADDLKIMPSLHFFETKKEIDARNMSRNFDLIALKLNNSNGLNITFDIDDEDQAILKQEMATTRAQLNKNLNAAVQDPAARAALEKQLYDIEKKISDAALSTDADDAEAAPPETKQGGFTFSNVNGDVYEVDSWTDIIFSLVRNPAQLNAAFYKYLPRIIFFMMPFTMLIGAMFIRGRGNALLYDHLVHAAYIHAFAFFLLMIGIILNRGFPNAPIGSILFIILLVYLPLSLKRMFARSWVKTIWTSYGVGFIYAFNMTLIMIGLLSMQLITTVTEHGTPVAL